MKFALAGKWSTPDGVWSSFAMKCACAHGANFTSYPQDTSLRSNFILRKQYFIKTQNHQRFCVFAFKPSPRSPAPAAQKSGQNIAVLPGWGEKTYLGDCCSVTTVGIRWPCHGRGSSIVKWISTFTPTLIITPINLRGSLSPTMRYCIRMVSSKLRF